MKKIRGWYRFFFFIAYSSCRIAQILILGIFLGFDVDRAMRIRRRWVIRMLPAMGMRIHVEGVAPDYPCIVMGNHRTYLDPAVLTCDMVCYAVSKAEVANWPFIGLGTKISGVIFLKRESKESRKIVLDDIVEKVKEGYPVILFPEGTTHAHPTTIDFRRGAFQIAAQHGLTVAPVAIDYGSTEDYWIGKDTFLPHFVRRFGEKNMYVYVRYGPPMQHSDPQILMEEARQWIDNQLVDIRRTFLSGPKT